MTTITTIEGGISSSDKITHEEECMKGGGKSHCSTYSYPIFDTFS
jgi:hypothetical protein